METKSWKKDPAFWAVLFSFVCFLAIAGTVFLSSRSTPRLRQGVLLFNDQLPSGPNFIINKETVKFTLDARNPKKWIYFNLSNKKIMQPRFISSLEWDLAFKRYHIIANGGSTNLAGNGGILDLGRIDFNAIPQTNLSKAFILNTKTPNGTDSENLAIRHWYSYDYTSHILMPSSHVYLVETPDRHQFAFRVLSYYCKSEESGCVSIEYYKIK